MRESPRYRGVILLPVTKMVETFTSQTSAISSGGRPFWSFFEFDFLRGEIYLVPSHPAALMSVLLQVQVDALFPGLTSWGL